MVVIIMSDNFDKWPEEGILLNCSPCSPSSLSSSSSFTWKIILLKPLRGKSHFDLGKRVKKSLVFACLELSYIGTKY